MNRNCEIVNCKNVAREFLAKSPSGKLWLCEEHLDEERGEEDE